MTVGFSSFSSLLAGPGDHFSEGKPDKKEKKRGKPRLKCKHWFHQRRIKDKKASYRRGNEGVCLRKQLLWFDVFFFTAVVKCSLGPFGGDDNNVWSLSDESEREGEEEREEEEPGQKTRKASQA